MGDIRNPRKTLGKISKLTSTCKMLVTVSEFHFVWFHLETFTNNFEYIMAGI